MNAIQLATASAYKVFATASPANFVQLRSLGAVQVFDYRSQTIVQDLLSACVGHDILGDLDCVGKAKSTAKIAEVLVRSNRSGTRRIIATVLPNEAELPAGVDSKYIHGVALKAQPGVSKALYEHF